MVCQRRYFCLFLLLCAILTALSGCVSYHIPITNDIIYQVKKDDNKSPKDFQYYLSKEITLKLVRSKEKYSVKSGKLIVTRWPKRDEITITENLPGAVYADVTETDEGGYLLEVYFEKKYPDSFIKFRQLVPGDHENYYLLYDDIQDSIIKYGDDNYTVSFDGIDPPFLWIKMRPQNKPKNIHRKASGVRIP